MEPQRDRLLVPGHFAADAYRNPRLLRGLNGLLQHAENGRVIRVIHVRDFLVHPVHGQDVLDQIIGADAEKVRFLGQQIGDGRRRRNLDHDTDLNAGIKSKAAGAQILFGLLQNPVGGPNFFQGGDHRVQDFHVAVSAGAQNRGQLGFEQLLAVKADADRPIAEHRIVFFRQFEIFELFVAADIQRPDYHGMRAGFLRHLPVYFKLLVFPRERGPVHVQKLRTEQTYAFGPVFHRQLQIFDRADIPRQTQADTVLRYRFHRRQQLQLFLPAALLLGDLGVALDDVRTGIKIYLPLVAVNDQQIARLHRFRQFMLKSGYKRDAQSPGHNGGMGRFAAGHRHHPQHIVRVEVHQLGRGQLLGHQNIRLRIRGQRNVRRSEQMLKQPVADVLDVERSFFHILIVQQIKHRDEMIDRFLDGHLRRLVLPFDNPPDFAHKNRVFQNGQMGIENPRFLRADRFLNFVLQTLDFGFGRPYAFVQTLEFHGEIHLIHPPIRHIPFPGGQHKSFADSDSRCCSDPLYHVVTPYVLL